MSVLRLQPGIIYGPVNSRRLGRSLGVNLLPVDYKLCSFDCIYCQYGRTAVKSLSPEAERFPGIEVVLQAVEEALKVQQEIAYLTFSGNGEPTLHPQFPAIVDEARRLLKRYRSGAKLALLSNSTTVHWPEIRDAICRVDVPIMHLDVGDARTLGRINRPAPQVRYEQIVDGLKQIPHVIIQSMLIDGPVSNTRGEMYAAWVAVLAQVRPLRVQVYSTERPVSDAGVQRVPPARLQRIAKDVQARTGISADAY